MGVIPVTMKNPMLAVVAANGAPQVDITLPKKGVASAKKARKSALVAREDVRPPTVESALTMRQLLAVADAYALAAGRIVDVRLARRAEMTDPEARTLERCEDHRPVACERIGFCQWQRRTDCAIDYPFGGWRRTYSEYRIAGAASGGVGAVVGGFCGRCPNPRC